MAVQTPYVEYIKISRTDELGQDLTPTLEALTQIKLPFTNGVSTTYLITSTTRYNDYFLFGISKTGASAPLAADAATLNYSFTSSVESSVSTPNTANYVVGLQTTLGTPINVETVTKDFNSLNLNKKVAVINTLPQKPIAVRISGSSTGNGSSGSGPFNLYVNGNSIGNIGTISFSSTTNFDVTLSIPTSSQSPGMEIYSEFTKYGGDVTEVTFAPGTTMFITSSIASGPTLETIPEPYLTSQFEGTDCDILLNNEELYRENPFLQDLDYDGDPNSPTNFQLIISGTAAKGTVPESYYTSLRQINPRYNGSKNQSKDFNIYKGTQSFPTNQLQTYSVVAGVPSQVKGTFTNPFTPFPIDLTLLTKPNIPTANPGWFGSTSYWNLALGLIDPPLGVFLIPKRGVPNLINPPNVKISWNGSVTVDGTTGEGKLKVRAGIMKNLNNALLYDNMQVILESDPIPAGSTLSFDLSGEVFNIGDIISSSNAQEADFTSPISSSYPVIWASLEEHTDNFNADTASFSSNTRITAEYFYLPENIGTFGKTPAIDSLDTSIYEFEWGGGTTPEILDYGAVKLGRILQVSSKDLVKNIDPSSNIETITIPSRIGNNSSDARNYRTVVGASPGKVFPPGSVNTSSVGGVHFWDTPQNVGDYYQVLNGNNPVNTEISMFMYPNSTAGSNPTLPSTTKILNTEWGVPTISNYALTSSNSSAYGTIGSSGVNSNIITLNRDTHISKVTTDSNGFYQSAANPIKPNWATIGDQINIDLNNGEKWFVTLYNEFEFPNGQGDYSSVLTTGSLSPFNDGITIDEDGNYSNALAYKGVYEIAGVYDSFGSIFSIMLYENFPDIGVTKTIGGNTPGNSLGMLIWKARAAGKNEFVLVQDSITGGVQAGAFTNKYAPNYLTENFEDITKEYGSNQTG